MTMMIEKMLMKSFSRPDEVRTFDKGKIELITVGDTTFGRATFQPGWKWSTCVKPLVHTESCQVAHLNCHISGRLQVMMNDGTSAEFGPGDVSMLPPGHDAWVVGNEPAVLIDITGAPN